LDAVSGANSILNTSINITYSIETNSDDTNISLSGNTIIVTNLDLLGDTGSDITVKATDTYGYSSNKTINVIKDTTRLYVFTSHTFTNGGASGRNGATLAQYQSSYSSASWTQYTNYFNMTTQGVQLWTVPKDGNYTIYCYGARGGDTYPPPNSTTSSYQLGGRGASIEETIYLFKNQVLSIVVGQQGGTSTGTDMYPMRNIAGGGGGGSFVYSGDLLYCVAGGGSGALHLNSTNFDVYYQGRDGSDTAEPNNQSNSPVVFDDINLGHGGKSSHSYGGGNGAGWLSDGLSSTNTNTSYTTGKIEGSSRPSWVGGVDRMYIPTSHPQIGGWGGFGGGGGVFINVDTPVPGAGGGYTGGYSVYSYNYAAGGGGSYFSSNGNYVGVNNNPGGYVVIHFIS